jgi:hypothetical protein
MWDGGIADHSIPNSVYYSSKPTYFGALTWPPFDPATPANAQAYNIPAGYRRIYGVDPPITSARAAIGTGVLNNFRQN